MASTLIEDHALLSDQRATALVTRGGTIDWLCMPRFDAAAVFVCLLGDVSHGDWTLRIADGEMVGRRYLPSTMVRETTWRSPTGTATVTDFMSVEPDDPSSLRGDIGAYSNLIRTVTCTEGEVDGVQERKIRFEYGAMVPWVRKDHEAGGERVRSWQSPALAACSHTRDGRHTVRAAQSLSWARAWFPSWLEVPSAPGPQQALARTTGEWAGWLGKVHVHDRYAEEVARSLLV